MDDVSHSVRSLWFYRAVTLALLAVVAMLGLLLQAMNEEARLGSAALSTAARPASVPANETAAPPQKKVAVIDLEQHAKAVTRGNEELSDFSVSLFHSQRGTMHLHMLGPGQTIPLHIHRRSIEATVVVTGTPQVVQVVRKDGAPARRESVAQPGTLVSSPVRCAHEWRNDAQDLWQANLVFAVPAFDGNLFLQEDDERITSEGPAIVIDPDELGAEAEPDAPLYVRPVATLPEQLSTAVIRDRMLLAVTEQNPALVYVARGKGVLHADGERALRAQHLAVLSGAIDAELRAEPDQPLIAYVFRPQHGGAEGSAVAPIEPAETGRAP